MTNMVKDRPVTAHVFEYTTSFALDADLHFKYPDKGIVPCQIIFCLKENNVSLRPSHSLTGLTKKARKINSHRWFFNAFAPLLAVSYSSSHAMCALFLTSAQHLRLVGRRDASGGQILVSLVESFRLEFQRRWCLRRDSDLQRKDLERSIESSGYVSFKWATCPLNVSCCAMLRIQDVKHS
jgi:hypothetical protein